MTFFERISGTIVREMGPAVIIPDGDCLYITQSKVWTICITNAALHIPPHILSVIHTYTDAATGSFFDWDLLTAVEISTEHKQYLPAFSSTVRPFVRAQRSYGHVTAEQLRAQIGVAGPCLYDVGMDVTQAFRDGLVRSEYPRKERGHLAAESGKADSYTLQRGRKVLSMDGPRLRGFLDMGFTVTCPSKKPDAGLCLAATIMEGGAYIFGFIALRSHSGITGSPCGRSLLGHDAVAICWDFEEDAYQLLQEDLTVFNPAYHGRDTVLLSLEERLGVEDTRTHYANREMSREFKRGIAILRWHGVPEEAILEYAESLRTSQWVRIHEDVLLKAAERIARLAGGVSKWEWGSADSAAKDMCKLIEDLEVLLGHPLDLGLLPEMIRSIKEGEQKAG